MSKESVVSSLNFQSVYEKIVNLESEIESATLKGSKILNALSEVHEYVNAFTAFLNDKLNYLESEMSNLKTSTETVQKETEEVTQELDAVMNSQPFLYKLTEKILSWKSPSDEPPTCPDQIMNEDSPYCTKLDFKTHHMANRLRLLYSNVNNRSQEIYQDIDDLLIWLKSRKSNGENESQNTSTDNANSSTPLHPNSNPDLASDPMQITDEPQSPSTSSNSFSISSQVVDSIQITLNSSYDHTLSPESPGFAIAPQSSKFEEEKENGNEKITFNGVANAKSKYRGLFKRRLPKSPNLSRIVDSDEDICENQDENEIVEKQNETPHQSNTNLTCKEKQKNSKIKTRLSERIKVQRQNQTMIVDRNEEAVTQDLIHEKDKHQASPVVVVKVEASQAVLPQLSIPINHGDGVHRIKQEQDYISMESFEDTEL